MGVTLVSFGQQELNLCLFSDLTKYRGLFGPKIPPNLIPVLTVQNP